MKRRDIIKGLSVLPFVYLPRHEYAYGRMQDGSFLETKNPDQKQLQADLHERAFVMDGHVHMMSRQLLQHLDIGEKYSDGHVDLQRAKSGGIDAMFFSVYTPEPYYVKGYEIKNTFRVIELALAQIEANGAAIELATTASGIEDINRRGKIAAFLDLEGGFDLEGDINLLRALYRLGLRSLQLTAHNRTNAFIDSCYGTRLWGGINEHGHTLIREMNRLGMVINVAHASDEAILQAAAASDDPVIYSHGGFRSIVNNARCISDEGARAIAAKGGVIGIQFGNSFNNPTYAAWVKSQRPVSRSAGKAEDPGQRSEKSIQQIDAEVASGLPFVFKGKIPDEYIMGVDQLARVIDYGVNLVGEDHIALGSDFDGGPPLPREIKDIGDYPQMTKAIRQLGYSESRIRKILGNNWLRIIREVTEKEREA